MCVPVSALRQEGGQPPALVFAVCTPADPTGYGRIVRKHDGPVAAIVEEKALQGEQRQIREVNSSTYCFTLEKLWPCLDRVRPDNVHREIYLTDAIALLDQQGEKVLAEIAPDPHEILGCNTRWELAEVDRIFRGQKRAALMEAGVTIYLPSTVTIDPEVEVGADTVIEPHVQLLGKTRIGADCIVRTGSVITDSEISDACQVRPHCVIAATKLGKGCVVGPFAHLRDGAELRPGARVRVLGEGLLQRQPRQQRGNARDRFEELAPIHAKCSRLPGRLANPAADATTHGHRAVRAWRAPRPH